MQFCHMFILRLDFLCGQLLNQAVTTPNLLMELSTVHVKALTCLQLSNFTWLNLKLTNDLSIKVKMKALKAES